MTTTTPNDAVGGRKMEEGLTSQPSKSRADALHPINSAATAVDETAWLIEETWTGPSLGQTHYIHRDFDAVRWRAEVTSLSRLPYQWVFSEWGGASLTRRKETVPFITKDANEAMRFPTREDAEVWLNEQPKWMSYSDQYQAREHMWCAPGAEGAASPTGQGTLPETGAKHRDDPQHLEARIRELEAENDRLTAQLAGLISTGDPKVDAAWDAGYEFGAHDSNTEPGLRPGLLRELQAQVEGCRGALEEIAAEEFKGPLGISIYQAAANELSRIKAVARQALALLKEPGNGK